MLTNIQKKDFALRLTLKSRLRLIRKYIAAKMSRHFLKSQLEGTGPSTRLKDRCLFRIVSLSSLIDQENLINLNQVIR